MNPINQERVFDYISGAISYPGIEEAQLVSIVILHFDIPDAEASQIVKNYLKAYKEGLRRGIWLFAWWKDGIQYVGSTGRTLEEALEEVSNGL